MEKLPVPPTEDVDEMGVEKMKLKKSNEKRQRKKVKVSVSC